MWFGVGGGTRSRDRGNAHDAAVLKRSAWRSWPGFSITQYKACFLGSQKEKWKVACSAPFGPSLLPPSLKHPKVQLPPALTSAIIKDRGQEEGSGPRALQNCGALPTQLLGDDVTITDSLSNWKLRASTDRCDSPPAAAGP